MSARYTFLRRGQRDERGQQSENLCRQWIMKSEFHVHHEIYKEIKSSVPRRITRILQTYL